MNRLRNHVAACILCLLIVIAPGLSGQAANLPEKKVLLIFADGPDFPYTKLMIDGFQAVMARQNPPFRITYYYEYLEAAKFLRIPGYFDSQAQLFQIKYHQAKPDLIVAYGVATDSFLQKYGEVLFPQVPVVFNAYAFDRSPATDYPNRYRRVTAPFELNTAVDTVLKLQPEISRLYLIFGDSEQERKVTAQYRQDLAARAAGPEFVWLNQLPIDNLLAKIKGLEPNSAILFINFHQDVRGAVFVPAQILREIASAANVPVFGAIQTHMGTGVVGGTLISFTAMGQQSAKIGLDLLGMAPVESSPTDAGVKLSENIFDWRQFRRWDISEELLPAGSRLEFRQPSAWDAYKIWIVGGLVFAVLQGLLITLLLRSRMALQRKGKDLRESEQRYRAIMQQSFDAISLFDAETRQLMDANDKWLQLFGYRQEDIPAVDIFAVFDYSRPEIDAHCSQLLTLGNLPPQIRRFRRKDGRLFELERVGALIKLFGKQLFVFSHHDISVERQQQRQISNDVALAAILQKRLLPNALTMRQLEVWSVFEPLRQVSGDLYNCAWNQSGTRFFGYIIDVSGHGVASSLLAQLAGAYFREAMESPLTLVQRLEWINFRLLSVFDDDNFAAAICFEFDVEKKTLKYATAGIYMFAAFCAGLPKIVTSPGSLLGITPAPELEEHIVQVSSGDAFYFMSDGIYEQLVDVESLMTADFGRMGELLAQLANNPHRHDDCTAVCIKVKDL